MNFDKRVFDFDIMIPLESTDLPARWRGRTLTWSGERIPAVGERVLCVPNGLGYGTVEGYFQSNGWLGVVVKLESPPEWHVKQNKGKPLSGLALVYGAEIKGA